MTRQMMTQDHCELQSLHVVTSKRKLQLPRIEPNLLISVNKSVKWFRALSSSTLHSSPLSFQRSTYRNS